MADYFYSCAAAVINLPVLPVHQEQSREPQALRMWWLRSRNRAFLPVILLLLFALLKAVRLTPTCTPRNFLMGKFVGRSRSETKTNTSTNRHLFWPPLM